MQQAYMLADIIPASNIETSNQAQQPVHMEASTVMPALFSQNPARSKPKSLCAIYTARMNPPDGSGAQSALKLMDPGATDNLITRKFARVLKLLSKPLTLFLRVLGH